jgi:transmembrane sensor
MSPEEVFQSLEEEVSSVFVQQQHGDWTPADQAALENRLISDLSFAQAYRLAQESVDILGAHTNMPEMMRFRERALAHARLATAHRWLGPKAPNRWRWAAAAAGVLVALAAAWQLSPWGYRSGDYRTGLGEQRIVQLDDHSRIALDAKTRITVHYTAESRTIDLMEGQAQFWVAKDPTRPFRVVAGDRTVIAVGTVFTVEYMDQQIHVALLEGRVAVVPDAPSNPPRTSALPQRPSTHPPSRPEIKEEPEPIELSAGEALSVSQDGRATVIREADLEAATAWRDGKVIFRAERLADAIQRMNRYSRVQLEISDPALANELVSGVFEAGDTEGFIKGVQLALPVIVSDRDAHILRLSLRR